MRILAALGGNALMRRGEHADIGVQLRNLCAAVPALARLADSDELVLTHGNGPQVGLLAGESATDGTLAAPYPLDTLGAETQGMIGYWMVRELSGSLPGRELVAVLTQTRHPLRAESSNCRSSGGSSTPVSSWWPRAAAVYRWCAAPTARCAASRLSSTRTPPRPCSPARWTPTCCCC